MERQMAKLTEALAEYAAKLDGESLPPPVCERARALILDLWGIMLRARHDAESTPAIRASLAKLGQIQNGPGNVSVVGEINQYAPPAAALFNGALAHSLDFDDTHAPGSIHPGAVVIPASLAVAEPSGRTLEDVIPAIVAGYDITCRISLALVPSLHYARGFHPTATAGAFGAAAAAGRVLGLSSAEIASAFGLVGSMAAGSLQFLANGAWNKRWQVGAAAANGLTAAVAAKNGFVGAADPIEGKHGFLNGHSSEPRPELALELLGTRHEIMRTAVKPYPACRYAHAALDAITALRAERGFSLNDIRRVQVGLPQTGLDIIGQPEAQKRRPKSVVDGQFSMHFAAAVALKTGDLRWDDYVRYLGDSEVAAFCDRIVVHQDPIAEANYPRWMSASVTIDLGSERLERFVKVPRGEPENFLSDDCLRAKFDGLCAPYLDAASSDTLCNAILAPSTRISIGNLFSLSRCTTDAAAE